MDFVTSLILLINWKYDSYNAILVVINYMTKKVHYKPIITTIDVASLVEIIIDVIVKYYSTSMLIIYNRGSLFTSKFWFLLCYFLSIK